jgi:hypothetical protein
MEFNPHTWRNVSAVGRKTGHASQLVDVITLIIHN